MPLLGSAAMLLTFDVDADAIEEHDRWHTHEHLPERLAIPGFLRGTRWVATKEGPRYMVVYEVEGLATLASAPYLARPVTLSKPSWRTGRVPMTQNVALSVLRSPIAQASRLKLSRKSRVEEAQKRAHARAFAASFVAGWPELLRG